MAGLLLSSLGYAIIIIAITIMLLGEEQCEVELASVTMRY